MWVNPDIKYDASLILATLVQMFVPAILYCSLYFVAPAAAAQLTTAAVLLIEEAERPVGTGQARVLPF